MWVPASAPLGSVAFASATISPSSPMIIKWATGVDIATRLPPTNSSTSGAPPYEAQAASPGGPIQEEQD
eukprot:8078776-Prorocentrum_lima.AAC.1